MSEQTLKDENAALLRRANRLEAERDAQAAQCVRMREAAQETLDSNGNHLNDLQAALSEPPTSAMLRLRALEEVAAKARVFSKSDGMDAEDPRKTYPDWAALLDALADLDKLKGKG